MAPGDFLNNCVEFALELPLRLIMELNKFKITFKVS